MKWTILLVGALAPQFSKAEKLIVTRAPDLSTIVQVRAYLGNDERIFQLDTGANLTMVKFDDQTLGLPKIGTVLSASAAGKAIQCDLILIPRFKISHRVTLDQKATRCDLGPRSSDSLGIDVLDHQIWILDFNRSILHAPKKYPPSRLKNPLRRYSEGHLAISAMVADNPLYAIFDTGAQITAIDQKYIDANPDHFTFIGNKIGVDATGNKVKLLLYSLDRITIGGQIFENIAAAAFDFGASLRKYFGEDTPVILGTNVITNGNWVLDLKDNFWSIY